MDSKLAYSIAILLSINLIILFKFATMCVKYDCTRTPDKPTVLALHNPCAIFVSAFFASILYLSSLSVLLKYSVCQNHIVLYVLYLTILLCIF